MSDSPPYGDDPSSSSDYVSDYTSGHPPQPDPCSDYGFDPYASITSDTGSDDSADSRVQRPDLQMCGTSAQARKKSKKKGQHQWWIATWDKIMEKSPESDPRIFMPYFVSIDGYYREGRKGGHGVIIRDEAGQPVVASAVASSPVSFLYHQVMGVFRAVELAVQYSLEDIRLFCNAIQVARLVNRAMASAAGCTIHTGEEASFDVICKTCVQAFAKEDTELVFPLLREAARNRRKFVRPRVRISKVQRVSNKAADFLAKNGAAGREVREPCEFPDELKEILCNDYVDSEQYGLPARC